MINKVKRYISENNLIEKDHKIILALSGGVDSMVLFDILLKLNYQVIIAHVNHKRRIESDMEEEEILKLCKEKNVICEVLHLDHLTNDNFHNQAHNKRYEFYDELAMKYQTNYIATAHHLDDNIETILLNIMSGSNVYGYAGIAPKVYKDNKYIIRPLLCVSKNDIREYAKTNNIKFYEDYTNNEDHYKRNRIRHHIIPLLKEEASDILEKCYSYSTLLRESFNFLRQNSINYLDKYHNKIDNKSFALLDIGLKHDIITLLCERYNILKNKEIINKLCDLIISDKPELDYDLKNNYIFKKRYDVSYLDTIIEPKQFDVYLNDKFDSFKNEDYHIYFKENIDNIELNNYTNIIKLCYNKISLPLHIRKRSNGDVILMTYGHKKIKDLLIDKKITKESRERILVVEDSNKEILWVVNVAKSALIKEDKINGNIFLVIEEIKK